MMYRNKAKENMSSKGKCCDNVCTESFYATLKLKNKFIASEISLIQLLHCFRRYDHRLKIILLS